MDEIVERSWSVRSCVCWAMLKLCLSLESAEVEAGGNEDSITTSDAKLGSVLFFDKPDLFVAALF
jgi:hypothetical protein